MSPVRQQAGDRKPLRIMWRPAAGVIGLGMPQDGVGWCQRP
jgi:hypothetical protein